ncbi:MAG TPA: hypothetical protein VGF07_10965, partial [Stellaceae bacterium]
GGLRLRDARNREHRRKQHQRAKPAEPESHRVPLPPINPKGVVYAGLPAPRKIAIEPATRASGELPGWCRPCEFYALDSANEATLGIEPF